MAADRGLSETAECLCLASRRAARAITRAFDRELRAHGIRATQFSVLAILTIRGPHTVGDLAGRLGVDRTTLTRNLAVVQELGLVRIRPGDDARARVVTVTAKGRNTVNGALPTWRRVQSGLTAAIGSQAADGLRRLARAPHLRGRNP